MKSRFIAGVSAIALFASVAAQAQPITFRAADGINNTPVSAANPLPVTGGGSSGGDVNLNEIAGTTTSTGNGTADAGTQRVTIASDSGVSTAAAQATTNTNTGNTATSTAAAAAALGAIGDAAWSSGNGTAIAILKAIVAAMATPNPDCGANPCTNRLGLVQPEGWASMGATPYGLQSAASTNSTTVKSSAGTLTAINYFNTTTTIYYLRMYNASSAPTCSSATNFVRTWPLPPASAAGGSGGATIDLGTFGSKFTTGISFCLTGGPSSTDNTNAATGVFVNLDYF